jgi:hypothetical protein
MKRNVSAWRQPKHSWDTLGQFLASKEIAFGIHSICFESVYLDIFINIVPKAPLFVFFHGNCPRADNYYLPVFSGFSVTEGLAITTVVPSDPVLLMDDRIDLSWHAGGKNLPLQQLYFLALRHIQIISQAQSMTFWGGSGGGFAALYYSSRFPDSFAFVWNPQTNVLEYIQQAVEYYAQIAYGVSTLPALSEAAATQGICLNLCNSYFANSSNHVIYLQNLSDWHFKQHLQPFVDEFDLVLDGDQGYLGMPGERLLLAAIDISNDHEPPPPSLIKDILAVLATRAHHAVLGQLSARILELVQASKQSDPNPPTP